MPDANDHKVKMAAQRSAFAIVYWGFVLVWVVATVLGLIWGSQTAQTIVALTGLSGLVVLSIVRQVLAARLQKSRDAELDSRL